LIVKDYKTIAFEILKVLMEWYGRGWNEWGKACLLSCNKIPFV